MRRACSWRRQAGLLSAGIGPDVNALYVDQPCRRSP